MADATPKTYKAALTQVSEAQATQRAALEKRGKLMRDLEEVEDELRQATILVGTAREALQLRIDADLAKAAADKE